MRVCERECENVFQNASQTIKIRESKDWEWERKAMIESGSGGFFEGLCDSGFERVEEHK